MDYKVSMHHLSHSKPKKWKKNHLAFLEILQLLGKYSLPSRDRCLLALVLFFNEVGMLTHNFNYCQSREVDPYLLPFWFRFSVKAGKLTCIFSSLLRQSQETNPRLLLSQSNVSKSGYQPALFASLVCHVKVRTPTYTCYFTRLSQRWDPHLHYFYISSITHRHNWSL